MGSNSFVLFVMGSYFLVLIFVHLYHFEINVVILIIVIMWINVVILMNVIILAGILL